MTGLFPHSKQEERTPSPRLEFSLRSILPVPTRREGKTKANFIKPWLASQRLLHLFQFKSTGLLDLCEHEYKR